MADTVNIAIEATDDASDIFENIGDSAEEMGKSGEQAAKDFAKLSERLEGLDQAQVGRAAIDQLDRSLSEGRITAEQYSEAVEKIQQSTGSASEAAMKAAEDMKLYTEQLERGDITAEEYAEKIAKMSGSTDDVTDSMQDATKATTVMRTGFTELNSALSLLQQGLGYVKQAFDMAKEGAAIQRIGDQFNATMAEIGISADGLIAKMDEVTGRTVDDEELMRIATRAFTQDLVSGTDEIVGLLEIARASATRFGGDTASAFEQIALATETGMVRSLKARGIVLDLAQVYDDYAKSLGKSRKELTETEEKQARLNAVLAKGAELVEKVGDSVEDNLSKFQRFDRQMGDLGDDVKVAATNAFVPMLDVLDRGRIITDTNASASARLDAIYKNLGSTVVNNNELAAEQFGVYADLVTQLRQTIKFEEQYGTTLSDSGIRTSELIQELEGKKEAEREAAEATAEAARQEELLAQQRERQQEVLAGIAPLAIEYTKRNKELAEIQGELIALDAEITERGERRIVMQQAGVETINAFEEASLRLQIAQQNLSEVTMKAGESDAEFSLRKLEAQTRVDELTGKVEGLSGKMSEHAVAVGGATEEQLKQRDALLEQIAAFQQATEIEKATQAFDALNSAFAAGVITQEQYLERADRLNKISGLYTESALKEATSQQVLIDALTDPANERWYAQLISSRTALDGIVGATETVAQKTKDLSEERMRRLGEDSEEAFGKTKKGIDESTTAIEEFFGGMDVVIAEGLPDLQNTSENTTGAMVTGFDEVRESVQGAHSDVADLADGLANIPRNIIVNVRINTIGNIPGGGGGGGGGGEVSGQRGLDFVVPPGFPGDSAFVPLKVSSGERVIVVPQGGGVPSVSGGDTVIINDRLALAQYYEQKRARWIERSAARMR